MNFKYYKTELLIIFIIVIYFPCSYLSEVLERAVDKFTMLSRIVQISDSLSTLTFMTVVIFFIDRIGWRWRLFKWLVDLPDLNGRYKGQLESSFKDAGGQPVIKDCVIEIKQTASKIHISSYFAEAATSTTSSSSHSVLLEVKKEENGFFKLYYIFVNDTGSLQGEVRNHSGTANFYYFPDNKSLAGDYYNQRLNKGEITVQFQQKKRLGRFNE